MAKGGAKKAAARARRDAANRLLADNRLARHQYEILDTLETGIELLGTEVKSIRAGQVNLRDGFCLIRNGELQLHNVHIAPHSHAGAYFNHDPLRVRKLLAHRREIDKLRGALDQKGLTLVPLNLHLKGSWIKVTLGLAKGRKLHDKRQEERRKQEAKETRAAIARI
ncbi:SsrA-binding protein SmpB [Aphanothece stagnina]|uniref:SsrA-binding protein SmpB n=2 Tax=Aphanothece TaxID=1121 RepID=UPI00398E9233